MRDDERWDGRLSPTAYMWLNTLRVTPNIMWMIPRMTDIFILKEFKKVSLLLERFQICVAQLHTQDLFKSKIPQL